MTGRERAVELRDRHEFERAVMEASHADEIVALETELADPDPARLDAARRRAREAHNYLDVLTRRHPCLAGLTARNVDSGAPVTVDVAAARSWPDPVEPQEHRGSR